MSNLLDLYEQMKAETVKQAEQEVVEEQAGQEVEVLAKYAAAADAMLAENGDDYDKDDVVKLAADLYNHDVAQYENMEKIAEAHQLGQIMGDAFINTIKEAGLFNEK